MRASRMKLRRQDFKAPRRHVPAKAARHLVDRQRLVVGVLDVEKPGAGAKATAGVLQPAVRAQPQRQAGRQRRVKIDGRLAPASQKAQLNGGDLAHVHIKAASQPVASGRLATRLRRDAPAAAWAGRRDRQPGHALLAIEKNLKALVPGRSARGDVGKNQLAPCQRKAFQRT